MIRFKNVCKKYEDGKEAVKNLNLTIEEGELCILIGPSGCGKSTTLRMINRLIEPTSGQIYINGKSIYDFKGFELRRNIGYAIQEVALFPHMTVAENINVVPSLKKWSKKDKNERVDVLLDLVGLAPALFRNKYPSELSGGERQRIGVARAMGADPAILLMDEPFGAIDPINRSRLQDEFLSIQEKIRKTIIFVTHDIDEALKMGDKIAIMKEGELIQFDTPKNILSRPVNTFVEDFMGDNRIVKWLQLIPVEEAMWKKPLIVSPNEKVKNVLSKMYKNGIPFCLVADKSNRLLGYVTQKNLLNSHDGNIKTFIRLFNEYLERKTRISDAFYRIMKGKTDFLPVVDHQNKIEGLLTLESVNRLIDAQNSSEVTEGSVGFDS